MILTINDAFAELQLFEGGDKYTETPGDLGGGTKYGISKAAFPNEDIKNLTAEQALTLYKINYWDPCRADALPPGLKYIVFDTAVNCGVKMAIQILQQAVGVTQDGIIGDQTIQAIRGYQNGMMVLAAMYIFYREAYDAAITEHRIDQIKFLGGWTNRNISLIQKVAANTL